MSLIRGEQISGSVASASYALTASYALNAGFNTGSFVLTSSFNTFTSSYYAASASFSANINSLTAATSSYVQNSQTSSMTVLSSSYALTASLAPNYLPLTGGTINGNVVLNGTASIAFLNVTYESASVIYSSGSNQFGDATNDTQTLIGRVIVSGGLEITGSTYANVTGSLFGTSSWAVSSSNASTASYVNGAVLGVNNPANYATNASTVNVANKSDNVDYSVLFTTKDSNGYLQPFTAFPSVFQYNPSTNKLIVSTVSASSGITGSLFGTSSWAYSASNAVSSSYSLSSSYAFSSSYALSSSYSVSSSYAVSSSYSQTSSYSIYAETASYAQSSSDILVTVINQSGAQINKGIVVRITGSNNSSDTPRIGVADYTNDNFSANTIGLVLADIPNGGTGQVMTEGLFKGYDTSTPGWTTGQLVFLGANGSITGSAPVAPLHGVRLGQVTRVQSNNGAIYIRIDNGYELDELHDVKITNVTPGDLLIRSSSVWINSKTLSGSYILSGSLTTNDGVSVQTLTASSVSASGGITGSLLGTATTASYVNGNIFTNSNSAASASYAATSVYPLTVTGSSIYSTGPSTGNVSANNGIFLGGNAGGGATSANLSVFLGYYAGQLATNANESTIIGPAAGLEASKADHSVFVGSGAGYKAVSASYSIIIGSYAGSAGDTTPSAVSVGTNNILIGNYVTLPSKSRDSINIGGIIFATGSYSNMGTTYSGSQYNIGRVGINKVTPEYTLDVSGSGNYSNGLTVTGSLRAISGITGSLSGTSSWADNASTASYIVLAQTASYVQTAQTASYVLQAVSSSYSTLAQTADTASYVITAQTASYVLQAVSSSFTSTASFVTTAQTASYVLLAQTASFVANAQTASYVLQAVSSSFASTASFVTNAQTASYVVTALTASYVTASNVVGIVTSASYALSSSYALNGGVTQIIAGTNINITNGGSGSVTITSTGGGSSGAGANVTASFTSLATWTFIHGLSNRGVVVQTYDTSWNQIIPQNITLTDANTATISFPSSQSGYAIASLGGVAVSASYALTASSTTAFDGAWTSYTPSWSTPGTQPSIGNGTLSGAYKQIGKTVFVRVRLVFGTTTAGGTGDWQFGLPVSASSAAGIQFPCSILDAGNAWYQATANGQYSGVTDRTSIIGQSSGANSSQGITSTFPITWGNLDSLQFNGSYESI